MNFVCFFSMAKNSILNPNKTNKINIELILWYSISKFGWQKKLRIFPSSLREITSSYRTSDCIIKRYLGTWELFYIVKYNAVSIKARVCYFQLTHAHTNSHTHTFAKGWMHYMHIWCNLCTDYVWNICSKKNQCYLLEKNGTSHTYRPRTPRQIPVKFNVNTVGFRWVKVAYSNILKTW